MKNNENHEHLTIPLENHETNENHRILSESYENQEKIYSIREYRKLWKS